MCGWRRCDTFRDVSEFKYLRCVLHESGTPESECSRKVAGAIRFLQL